jgi:hypothetical protein
MQHNDQEEFQLQPHAKVAESFISILFYKRLHLFIDHFFDPFFTIRMDSSVSFTRGSDPNHAFNHNLCSSAACRIYFTKNYTRTTASQMISLLLFYAIQKSREDMHPFPLNAFRKY